LRGHFPIARHRLWQVAIDAGLIAAAWYLTFQLRFDKGVPIPYQRLFEDSVGIVIGVQLVVFVAFGFYNRMWRYVSTRDMWGAARGVTAACVASSIVVYLVNPVPALRLPRSVALIDWVLLLAFVAGTRMLARTLLERPSARDLVAHGKEVIVVGAGDAGHLIVKEMLRQPSLGYTPIGLVDDDPKARNLRVHGVRVLGTTDDLPAILHKQRPDEVLIAIPSAPGSVRARVVDIARREHISVKTLPGLHELIAGDLDLAGQIRPVQVEDVLGREPVKMELDRVGAYMQDKVVLVTGAGGSIGAELVRQIARVRPRLLVILDHAEDNLFRIDREMIEERHFTRVESVLADCKEPERMLEVMQRFKPEVVFHAAAYKHVPLMEANPLEAIRNNAIATRVTAETAVASGCERFVLVSTDKAVNPRTVMGASKAMAEWIVEAAGRKHPQTRFVTVRFGNVLASSGSVVPIFRSQIERGGPVTVTDPEMSRYFMTIPEAVQLVIRSGDLGGASGEVFVLEMGEPVKIVDLAHNMIRLAGYEPEVDIAIEFVGARPGEKLHEDLFNTDERPQPTAADRIVRAVRQAPLDPEWVNGTLTRLESLVSSEDEADLAVQTVQLVTQRRAAALPVDDVTA
jgi:FlaA1/EpsC-like NDP-sugar epimerase